METFISSILGTLAMAGGQGGQAGAPGGGGMEMILMMVVIFGLMYFMVIRPQKTREKKRREMQMRIKAGDKVRTIGGLYGEVVSVNEKTIIISVDGKTNLEFVREAVNPIEEEAAEKKPEKK